MEQVEYPPMSGTNTICVATALLETGMVPMQEPVTELVLEAPAGLVARPRRVRERQGDRRSPSGTCRRSPSHLDATIEVPHLGTVTVDVAWGGMFYVIADAAPFGLRLTPDEGARHRPHRRDDQGGDAGAAARRPPGEPGDRGRHHRAAVRAARSPRARTGRTRSSCRPASWTGTGRRRGPAPSTGRRAAPAPARRWRRSTRRGSSALGQDFRHEGILGTHLHRPAARGDDGRARIRAVVPTISGRAWITGIAQYVVDAEDPFPEGFTVGDIW